MTVCLTGRGTSNSDLFDPRPSAVAFNSQNPILDTLSMAFVHSKIAGTSSSVCSGTSECMLWKVKQQSLISHSTHDACLKASKLFG